MRVGVLRADLMIMGAQSLKEKRRVLRSLKDRLMSHLNVSVAEVGAQDLWQRALLGVAMVALDAKSADAGLRAIEEFIRRHPGAVVLKISRAVLDTTGDERDTMLSAPGSSDDESVDKYADSGDDESE